MAYCRYPYIPDIPKNMPFPIYVRQILGVFLSSIFQKIIFFKKGASFFFNLKVHHILSIMMHSRIL